LILSGNCNAGLGAIAGIDAAKAAIVWLDAHPDFHTPETSASGFLDGMGLAIATGACWGTLAGSIPGFLPVEERNTVLVGARDIDPGEQERLGSPGSSDTWILKTSGATAQNRAPRTGNLLVHPEGTKTGRDLRRALGNGVAGYLVLRLSRKHLDPGQVPSARCGEAERELARQAEVAYERTVADWQSTQAKKGASVTPGRASHRPSKGKAARQTTSP
jgi:hypothetical protein